MERKNTFIKIHCVKIILMFVFSWAFNQSRVRALCVLSMYVSIHFWPFFIITLCTFEHDFESNTHTHETHWHVCNACILIGLVGLKSHTSFIHQVLSDMNSWRKERLFSLSHPCAKPSHFVFWLKRIDIIAPVFRPSNEHPTNKQTEKKTQEHFFIDVIIW